MADEHPDDAPAGAPADDEHAEVGAALDRIEACLNQAAATLARTG